MISPFGLKRSSWLWHVTLLSFVLGMLLAAALKTQQTIKFAGIPSTRLPILAQSWASERERNRTLEREITDQRETISKYEKALGEGGSSTGILSTELQNARFQAGLLPAQGEGVIVTLQDSKRRPPADASPEMIDDYNIHDYDIRDFVNELLASGAEALAVNEQRIIANTPIRCAGTRILINNAPMSPPFIITAIGPAEEMENGLKMRGGVVDQFRIMEDLSDMVKIERSAHLRVPAYSGSTQMRYAKPVVAEGGVKQ